MKSRPLWTRVIPIASLLLLVLFKFQNCAPAPSMVAGANGGGEVRIVDQWAPEKVSFLSPTQVISSVPADQPAELQGLCVGSAKGQMINYQVIMLSDVPQVVSTGQVECVMGGFQLPITGLQFNSCTDRLQVRAARQGDEANYGETFLEPDCQGT